MKPPCKKCLVRPACSEDCDEYKKFINYASIKGASLAVLLSSICFSLMLIYLGDILTKEPNKEFLQTIWFFTIIPNLIYNYKTKKHFNTFAIILCSPFVSFLILFINLFVIYDKRGLRKRV